MNRRAPLAQNLDLATPARSARFSPRLGYVAPQVASSSVKISRRFLLNIYWIIPIAIAVALIDLFLFQGRLMGKLPQSPDDLLLFAVFFNLPHIIASSVSFADTEYVKHYGLRVVAPVLVILGSLVIFPGIFFNPVFSTALYLWTVIHVLGQQFGMIRLMGKIKGENSSKLLDRWKWVAITMGVIVYFGTYASQPQSGQWLRHCTLLGVWTIMIPFSYLGWKIYHQADSDLGRKSILANYLMVVSIVALYQLGYSFFVLLIPRVIHDLSAFVFYSAHDLNRNRSHAPNLIYRSLKAMGLPMRLLTPGFALAITFPLTYYFHHDASWAYKAAIGFTLFHYYTDRFVWKNDSPLRQSISFN